MKRLFKYLAIAAAITATACSDDNQFRVSGHVEGDPTMNLRVGYYSRGAYQSMITAAREGDFEFFGNSPQPAVIEVFDYDNRLLGRGYISNGQSMELTLDPTDYYATEATGNDVSVRWNDFLRDNAEALRGGGAAANTAIAGYIGGHRDDIVSTLLLAYHYDAGADAAGADSLLELISPTARPAALTESLSYQLQRLVGAADTITSVTYFDGDSAAVFTVGGRRASAIAIDDANSRADSIADILRAMHRRRGGAVLEIGSDADMTNWRVRLVLDSADWKRGWMSAPVADPQFEHLGITALPYFIVADSAGAIRYRGQSAGAAASVFNDLTTDR